MLAVIIDAIGLREVTHKRVLVFAHDIGES
jgi:hypothetical protein